MEGNFIVNIAFENIKKLVEKNAKIMTNSQVPVDKMCEDAENITMYLAVKYILNKYLFIKHP